MVDWSKQFWPRASRRSFLSKVVAAGAALAPKRARPAPSDPERERISRLVEKYGSELGELRRIQGSE